MCALVTGVQTCALPFLTAPSSEICDTPVKPTPSSAAVGPCSTGTPSFTSIRTRTNCGSSGHSAISRTCPDGTPENCTCAPLFSPSTDCLKNISYSRFVPPLSLASQTMNTASAAVKRRTKAPTRTLFERVSISCSYRRQRRSVSRFGSRPPQHRSEEHTSELQSLMRISYAVFCLQKKKNKNRITEQ